MTATLTFDERSMSATQYGIVRDVLRERVRQTELQKAGRFKHTIDDPTMTDEWRMTVLVEEVGEAATEVNESTDKGVPTGHLRDELIQVIAVAVGWIERMDKDGRR